MRKQIEFVIERDSGSMPVRMHELTVRELLDLSDEIGTGSIMDDVERLAPVVSNLTPEDLLSLTPGELEEIWVRFREVNGAFFRMAEALGFGVLMETMRARIRECLEQSVSQSIPQVPEAMRFMSGANTSSEA